MRGYFKPHRSLSRSCVPNAHLGFRALRVDWCIQRLGALQTVRGISDRTINGKVVSDAFQYQDVSSRRKEKICEFGTDDNHFGVVCKRTYSHRVRVVANDPRLLDSRAFRRFIWFER